MECMTLIATARARGLSVQAADGKLIVRGPREEGALAQQLIARKAEVLAALEASKTRPVIALEGTPAPTDAGIAAAVARWSEADQERYHERAAIREYDGGMERQAAERAALADLRPGCVGLVEAASRMAEAFEGTIETFMEGEHERD